jgi:hypothetical protein
MVNNVIGVVNYVIAARPSLLNFVNADIHCCRSAGHLPDAEAQHGHLISIREDAGAPVRRNCADCHGGCCLVFVA